MPRTLNLRELLVPYVAHQIEVITRRSQFRLDKLLARAHIVEGLIKALDLIDEIISLIRASEDRPAAREGLMGEGFEFSEIQANHILDMPLGRLTRLGRSELEKEMAELRERKNADELLRVKSRFLSVSTPEVTSLSSTMFTPPLSR